MNQRFLQEAVDVIGLKRREGQFAANDLWGDGWGWALFEAKDPKRNVATDYRTDCKTCHIPAKKDDWVYVRGYPALAKPNLRCSRLTSESS